MKKLIPIIFLSLLSLNSFAQTGSAWAWDKNKISNNGSVSLKLINGSSYSATQNPTGAVAKTNQSAVTQPPTVIIQATSGSTSSSALNQVIPLQSNNLTIPICPAGYSSIFSQSGTGWGGITTIININGTRFSFGYTPYPQNGAYVWVGFYVDGTITSNNGALGFPSTLINNTNPWSVNLCSK